MTTAMPSTLVSTILCSINSNWYCSAPLLTLHAHISPDGFAPAYLSELLTVQQSVGALRWLCRGEHHITKSKSRINSRHTHDTSTENEFQACCNNLLVGAVRDLSQHVYHHNAPRIHNNQAHYHHGPGSLNNTQAHHHHGPRCLNNTQAHYDHSPRRLNNTNAHYHNSPRRINNTQANHSHNGPKYLNNNQTNFHHGPKYFNNNQASFHHGPKYFNNNQASFHHGPKYFNNNQASFHHGPKYFNNNQASFHHGPKYLNNNQASFHHGPKYLNYNQASFHHGPKYFNNNQASKHHGTKYINNNQASFHHGPKYLNNNQASFHYGPKYFNNNQASKHHGTKYINNNQASFHHGPNTSTTTKPASTMAPNTSTTTKPASTMAPNTSTTTKPDSTMAPNTSTTTKPASTMAPNTSTTTKPASTMAPNTSTTTKPASTMAPNTSTTTKPASTMAPNTSTTTKPASTMAPNTSTTTKPASTMAPNTSTTTKPDSTMAPNTSTTTKPASTMAPNTSTTTKPASTMAPNTSTTTKPASTMAPNTSTTTKPASTMAPNTSTTTKPASTMAQIPQQQPSQLPLWPQILQQQPSQIPPWPQILQQQPSQLPPWPQIPQQQPSQLPPWPQILQLQPSHLPPWLQMPQQQPSQLPPCLQMPQQQPSQLPPWLQPPLPRTSQLPPWLQLPPPPQTSQQRILQQLQLPLSLLPLLLQLSQMQQWWNLRTFVSNTDITTTECTTGKLCAAEPKDCDPTTGSCFFIGVRRKSGRNLDFEVAGETDGYVGSTLQTEGGNVTAYLCVKDNNKVIFQGASVENGKLKIKTVPVNNVKAKMNGRRVQCTFSATVPDATVRGADTIFKVAVVTGTYSPTSGEFGNPVTQIKTESVDLINPSANTTNVADGATGLLPPMSTGYPQPNVAVKGEATQSSTLYPAEANRAIDGRRDTFYTESSCSHTEQETAPWWRVDLGQIFMVSKVKVTNRGDCCAERLDGAEIHIGDSLTNNGNDNPRCAVITHIPLGNTFTYTCESGIMLGRYVNLVLPGDVKILTLCEVEVYADPSVVAQTNIVRLIKTAAQSTTYFYWNGNKWISGRAEKALQNCLTHTFSEACCVQTFPERNPWWKIDLGAVYRVSAIVIYNRADNYQLNIIGAKIKIGKSWDHTNNPVCAVISSADLKQTFDCSDMEGQYVSVNIPSRTQMGTVLTFCRVEVYGSKVESEPAPLPSPPPVYNFTSESAQIGGRTVTLVRGRLCWSDALFYCREHYWDLLSLHSQDEQTQVEQLIRNNSFSLTENVWLGLRREVMGMQWFWMSGEAVTFDRWRLFPPLFPNPCGGLDSEFLWSPLPCGQTNYFICQTEQTVYVVLGMN
ncbi:hypothetical protein WMY93_015052 [Mugilogobius chulae]|uniref:C-type lectin domain-containing protein n=1 Tax=Mugilogobius chulae TaxID=88201 RepID=A0AAW0P706_9GOBI